MLVLLTIAGGVALLLFGVRYLRKGLDRLFGRRLVIWMNRIASGRVAAFLSGIGVAFVTPSSTTVSLLAVQSVQAGHLSARRMMAVMLGANIGLTVMIQLIALDIDQFAPLLILVGFSLFQYTQRSRTRGIGQVILGLGFIFLALSVIRATVHAADLAANEDFIQLLNLVETYPFVVALLAAILTILLQSSTATLGLTIGMAAAGTMSLSLVLPVVLGANVGMSFTTLIFGSHQIDSRRLALGNLLLKLITALIAFAIFTIGNARDWFPTPDASDMALTVAMLHTSYNIMLAIIGLPLVGVVTDMVERWVPGPVVSEDNTAGPRFIQKGSIESVAMAAGQSRREIMHMSEIVRSMLRDVWKAMQHNDEQTARNAGARDDVVDDLDEAIKEFLTRLAREELEPDEADEQIRQLRCVSELETIGDIIDKNLVELVLKKIRLRTDFSDEGETELQAFYQRTLELYDTTMTAFATRDQSLAQQVVRGKERISRFENELRDQHFHRLNRGMAQSHETSSVHLDLLAHLKRISSALAHIAWSILEPNTRPTERLGSTDP